MIMDILLRLAAPRMLLAIAWFLVLVGGSLWMESRKAAPRQSVSPPTIANGCLSVKAKETLEYFSSNRDLAVNQRIVEADLNWSGRSNQSIQPKQFLGKYLACAVHSSEPVVLRELRDAPQVRASTGKSEYPLPLTGHLSFDLTFDVGSQIDLFEDSSPLLQKVPVLAVQCASIRTDDCAVLLELSPSDGRLLSRSDATKLRIVRVHP
jgi:hypothetical protein